MKASGSKVSPQTIERLVVARLLVPVKRPLSRNEVVQAVSQAICPPLSAAAAKRAVELVFAQCERSGLVVNMRSSQRAKQSKRKSEPRPKLAPKAQQLAASWHHGDGRVPVLKNWEHAQQWVALSRIERTAVADKVLHVDDLAAVILAERTLVPASASTLTAVIDYLAWRELGVETTAAFDIEAVQRHLLRKLVPADVRVGRTTWRRMLAMRAAGASGHDARALTQALFAQPTRPKSKQRKQNARARNAERSTSSKTQSSSANDNMSPRMQQPSLADFAAAVRAAARKPTVARFHADRAYIGSVWEHMQESDRVSRMSLADFKTRLIAAHRDGLLRITRADLVAAMDREEVERSEARYQDATFHFVAIEAGGGR